MLSANDDHSPYTSRREIISELAPINPASVALVTPQFSLFSAGLGSIVAVVSPGGRLVGFPSRGCGCGQQRRVAGAVISSHEALSPPAGRYRRVPPPTAGSRAASVSAADAPLGGLVVVGVLRMKRGLG